MKTINWWRAILASFLYFHFFSWFIQAQYPLPDDLNPGTSAIAGVPFVYVTAPQLDGTILIAGDFESVAGISRRGIASVYSDGVLNESFDASVLNDVAAICVQPDGKTLLGGDFRRVDGVARTNLARIDAAGKIDPDFVVHLGKSMSEPRLTMVTCIALQTNGQILVGGYFSTINGVARMKLARLHHDGSVDTTFSADVPGDFPSVTSIALQPDGKILVGGNFGTIGGQARQRIARLHSNGSVDMGFDPGADAVVYTLAVQTDGKILIGGAFTNIGGIEQAKIARLNADGSIDPEFEATASGAVYTMAQQADGKILVGGGFSQLCGQPRERLGRLNADGSLDETFTAGANNGVYSISLQTDGKALVGGAFSVLGNLARTNVGRLNATDLATQSLVSGDGEVTWLRGGSIPEVWRTTFEHTSDGSSWTKSGGRSAHLKRVESCRSS